MATEVYEVILKVMKIPVLVADFPGFAPVFSRVLDYQEESWLEQSSVYNQIASLSAVLLDSVLHELH